MTACERSATLFGRAWDDELTAAEKDGLERHFAACAPCRREYDELARTLELVQALPRPQVDDSFAGRVLAAAQERERTTAAAGRRLFALPATWSAPAFGRPALALAATFVVAAGIGAFLLARPLGGPSSPVLESPTVATTTTPPRVAAPTPSATQSAPAPDVVIARVEDPALATITPARRRAPAAVPAASSGTLAAEAPVDLDSLFDHSNDVELVLDPVQLRRERGRGYTPSSPTVKGEAASITF